jgi:hypothetical protein
MEQLLPLQAVHHLAVVVAAVAGVETLGLHNPAVPVGPEDIQVGDLLLLHWQVEVAGAVLLLLAIPGQAQRAVRAGQVQTPQ